MIELRIEISPETSEELEGCFCEELQLHWVLFQQEINSPWLLRGYFEDEGEGTKCLEELGEEVPSLKGVQPVFHKIEDQDWKLAYRHHLKPWTHGQVCWVPEWERETYPVVPGKAYLYLDSGMAFGTGSHETTRLCAEALIDAIESGIIPSEQCSVIDAGCGSGILALTAAALGVREVYAFDRDPLAVEVTTENLERNQLVGKVEVVEAGLEAGLNNRRAPILVANIQADVLMIYADNLVGAWDPSGVLILSGILAREYERVEDTFTGMMKRFHRIEPIMTMKQLGDWVVLVFKAP